MSEDATRILATLRPHRHVRMVCRVAYISATSRACRARGVWRTTRQTDKLNGEVASVLLLVMTMLRGNCCRGEFRGLSQFDFHDTIRSNNRLFWFVGNAEMQDWAVKMPTESVMAWFGVQ